MTPSQLKQLHEHHDPDSYFFSRKTMSFFGDTMRNFGVFRIGEYWVLYRKSATWKGAPPNRWLFGSKGELLSLRF